MLILIKSSITTPYIVNSSDTVISPLSEQQYDSYKTWCCTDLLTFLDVAPVVKKMGTARTANKRLSGAGLMLPHAHATVWALDMINDTIARVAVFTPTLSKFNNTSWPMRFFIFFYSKQLEFNPKHFRKQRRNVSADSVSSVVQTHFFCKDWESEIGNYRVDHSSVHSSEAHVTVSDANTEDKTTCLQTYSVWFLH